ncbi:MAG: hypothetical protein HGB30_11865, partial [Holophagaceae bacterium]|nr:hypothetical protein [Holophagaceae bacterium]
MRPSLRALSLLAVPALTGLALTLACGGSSQSPSDIPAPLPPITGGTAIILTDAPSDQWSAVEVVVTKVTLLNKTDH